MEFINYALANPVAFFGAIWLGLLPVFAYGIAVFFIGNRYIDTEILLSRKVWIPAFTLLTAISLFVFFKNIVPMAIYQYTGWFCIATLLIGTVICAMDYFADDHKFPRYYFSFGPMAAAALIYLPLTLLFISYAHVHSYVRVKFMGEMSEEEKTKEHCSTSNRKSETRQRLDEVIEAERKKDALIALYNEVLRSTDNPDERKIIQDYLKTL